LMEKLPASDISWEMIFDGYLEFDTDGHDTDEKLTRYPTDGFLEPRQDVTQRKVECGQISDKSESIHDNLKHDKSSSNANTEIKLSTFKRNKFLCQHSGCSKNFRDNHQLKIHERKHTGEKPHICDYPGCDRGFSQKNNLIVHRKNHEGIKPYECKLCEKKFAQKIHLNEHEKKHTDKRPYDCKFCDQKFKQKIHLKKHLTTRKHLRASSTFEDS
ncbi:12855_t:CDS:2, partial [Funneliformis geosporum]